MAEGRVRVDEEGRRIVWRHAAGHLWIRAATFLVLGIGLPVAVLGGGERPSWVTIPVLLVTAVSATWLVAALRTGWELDEHGIETDIGRRSTRRVAWREVDALAIENAELVATTREGRRLIVASGGPVILRHALGAAADLGIVPHHVDIDPHTGR